MRFSRDFSYFGLFLEIFSFGTIQVNLLLPSLIRIFTRPKTIVMQSEKIVAFGEIMMRLTPPDKLRFNQTDLLQVNYGGSEANVAVSLANYGLDSEFVTSLPANRIADACLDDLRSYRVGTGHILRAGDRIGLYYMEESAALRNSHVVYDRSGSSFAQLRPGQIDWEAILRGATWFHWSGIAAAVSESTAAVCAEAVTTARRM